jgi:hypothetical protein
LPIDDSKYSALISQNGLDGYKLVNTMHGNVTLNKDTRIILSLSGEFKSEIIPELNKLKGGKRRTRNIRKSKKSRKSRRKSSRRR